MPKNKMNKEERAAELAIMVAEAVRLEFERQRQQRKRKRAWSDQDHSSSDSEGGYDVICLFCGYRHLCRMTCS